MNKNYLNIIIIAIIIIVVIILGINFFKSSRTTEINPSPTAEPSSEASSTDASSTTQNASSSPSLMKSTGVLFSSSPDYKSAYRIYPTFVSPTAKKVVTSAGYELKSEDLGANMIKVSLVTTKTSEESQTFILGSDQKLYFIKSENGNKAVAVDAQGYILQ